MFYWPSLSKYYNSEQIYCVETVNQLDCMNHIKMNFAWEMLKIVLFKYDNSEQNYCADMVVRMDARTDW